MEIVLEIALQIGYLVGLAALIAMLINIGKVVGLVKDGDAGSWSAGLNLAALVVLVVLKLFRPDLELEKVDVELGALAQILGLVLSLLSQVKVSLNVHGFLSGLDIPVISKSFSTDFWKKDVEKHRAEQDESLG